MEEIWKPVVGYENCYEVSNVGRVRSLKKQGLVIANFVEKDGYKVVSLSKMGAIKTEKKIKKIHRLVAECFVQNYQNKPCVNHIDNDRKNNNAGNLEWVTFQENTKHMDNQGRRKVNPNRCSLTGKFTSKENLK